MRTSTTSPKDNKRRKRVLHAVRDGLKQWRRAANGTTPVDNPAPPAQMPPPTEIPLGEEPPGIFASIPRRRASITPTQDIPLPTIARETFKTSRLKAFRRVFSWLSMLMYFGGGTWWDWLLRRDNETRRATRLRRAFERAGGTFIKFGQQMAMRVDLLPWAYTVELAKMLDRVPPFPLEQALEVIERTTGQPWQETFAVFDPEPIGAASIACVYQAILQNGDQVAVKVRRPGVGELFAADFKVLDWLLELAEFLTLIRPGITRSLRKEFQSTLLEELDFAQETRFQDIFRRGAKKSGKDFFTAPKVHFELSNREVIVQRYTTGMWLWEVIAGAEQGDPQALRRMHELNIDPEKVANRLLWVSYWGMQENIIFHADPHPANIIVRPDSKLTFIDFGSCGSFNRDQRAALEQIAVSSGRNDPEGMARGAMRLFEPLPPVDVKELMQEAEAEYTRVLNVFHSKQEYTEWWERTSVAQWLSFFKFAQNNNIPINIHTLRMVRATLLYDTAAARLHNRVDRFAQYLRFLKYREQQARKRFKKRTDQRAQRGLDDTLYLRLEEMAKTGDTMMYRAQTMLSNPILNFGSLVGKWVFTISTLMKLMGRILLVTLLAVAALYGVQVSGRGPADILALLLQIVTNAAYQFTIAVLIVAHLRHILFRLGDADG